MNTPTHFIEQVNWLLGSVDSYGPFKIENIEKNLQFTATLKCARTVAIFKIKFKNNATCTI